MLLNCDLGESYGERALGNDAAIMPHIDQASVACGFHGGDPLTIQRTLALAVRHGVQIGAHPSYPDLEGFGRRSMDLPESELVACLHYQIGAVESMARIAGLQLAYVKPHGALYNDMTGNPEVRRAVLRALASYDRPLPLMLQATPQYDGEPPKHEQELQQANIEPLYEAFADRRYLPDGSLMPRHERGAVLDHDEILQQVAQLAQHGSVMSANGATLRLNARTLCIHGDNRAAASAVLAIRALLDNTK